MAAGGLLRIFNNTPASEKARQYVLYCPPGEGSPLPKDTKFHSRFILSDKHKDEAGDKLVCMFVVSPFSGRTALIFHGANGAGPQVTKYSHLDAIDPTLLNRFAQEVDDAIDVKQGPRLGTVGGSTRYSDTKKNAHLHFEVREFTDKVAHDWYTDKTSCVPEDFPIELAQTTTKVIDSTGEEKTTHYYRGYCGWSAARALTTVVDPEATLPPPPAASRPTNATGQNVEDDDEHAFAVQSAYPAGLSPTGLRVRLKAQIWRPEFYDMFGDWEFVAPASGVTPRHRLIGKAGTRPGVIGYRLDQGCAWHPPRHYQQRNWAKGTTPSPCSFRRVQPAASRSRASTMPIRPPTMASLIPRRRSR